MRKQILEEKPDSVYKDLTVEELREKLAEQDMKVRCLEEEKRTINKGMSSLIKQVKTVRAEVLDILEAKDSTMARKVLVEVTRKGSN